MSSNQRIKPKSVGTTNFTRISTETKQQQLLSVGLECFRQQQSYTDLDLECDGGLVHAHKIVLSASCPYFQTMFDSGLMEGNSSLINFKHWSYLAVEIIVTFLYTGKTPRAELGRQLLKEVASIAHMMQIEILFDYCWDALTKSLVVENFAEMWTLAETYELINKCKIIRQFAEKNFKQISEDPNVLLMDEMDVRGLVKYIAALKPCDDVVRFILRWDINQNKVKGVIELLKLVNLEEMSNEYLHDVIKYEQYLQQATELKILFTEEAVARLIRSDLKVDSKCQIVKSEKNERECLDDNVCLRNVSSLQRPKSPSRFINLIELSEPSIFVLPTRNENYNRKLDGQERSGVGAFGDEN